jgi:hypothetical protein
MIPEHLKQSLRRLREIDPKVDAIFLRRRTPIKEPDNLQLQRNHDLGLYDEPIVQKGPNWVQLALADIERYFGKGPIEG